MKQLTNLKPFQPTKIGWTPLLQIAVMILALVVATPAARAELQFEDADIYFELNNTDGDLGIHALIDGEPWKRLEIEGPNERQLLDIRVKSRLRRQGLTELFFESAEPPFDELAPERFFRRFPEGTYDIDGITLDNQEIESEDEVTHLMPAPPEEITVSGVEIDPEEVDCDEGLIPEVPASDPLVIRWEPVTTSHPDLGRTNEPIEVQMYQVVVENLDMETAMSIDLPPTETEVQIPASFAGFGENIKFEILVKEESGGNQTAVESCFIVQQP